MRDELQRAARAAAARALAEAAQILSDEAGRLFAEAKRLMSDDEPATRHVAPQLERVSRRGVSRVSRRRK